jgi:hypothetical protein
MNGTLASLLVKSTRLQLSPRTSNQASVHANEWAELQGPTQAQGSKQPLLDRHAAARQVWLKLRRALGHQRDLRACLGVA